jgi:hypothetical protein
MSFDWSSVSTALNSLSAAGVSLGPNVLQTLGLDHKLSTNTTALLTQAAAVSNDAATLATILGQVIAQPGFPTDQNTIGMVESLKAPGIPPVIFAETITAIEAKVAAL